MSLIPVRWAVLAGALGLAGCAGTAPMSPQPETWLASTYVEAVPEQRHDLDIERWRALWRDPLLDHLLAKAAVANLDARLAWTRVQQARAGMRQLASRKAPDIAIEGSASDERTGLPETVKQGNPDVRAYRGGLTLGWELDLWGAVEAAAQAGRMDALAAEAGAEATQWLAQHEVVRHYLIWQGARSRLEVLEPLVAADREAEAVVRRRLQEGMASAIDVANREAERQQTESQIPALQTLVKVTAHQLTLLVGEKPGALQAAFDQAPSGLPVALTLPIGMPIDLIRRRPDLIVAEHQLMAETQRLRMADADLWPKVFLGAALGQQDLRLNGMDLAPVRFSQVALAFTFPLFNAGRLQAAVEQQSARQREATLNYEKAVLQALTDVENSLVVLRRQEQSLGQLRAVWQARQDAERRGERLFREGLMDPLQRVGLTKAQHAARLSLTESALAVSLATLQLYRSLGGGWADQGMAGLNRETSAPIHAHRSHP